MTNNPTDFDLDPVLHQPIRTRIVAFLVARGEATFTELKQTLDITDGNLEAHMKKLKASGYITTQKQSGSGRPQTLYSVTQTGHKSFKKYIESLQNLLNIEFNA
ncbi:winged helix-turn-helix domain-containing protein [Kaarinaea lacus]